MGGILSPVSQCCCMHTSPLPALLITGLLLALLAAPAVAALVPREIQVNPPGEMLPAAASVNVSAAVEIIPSGATTFADTHTLSLSTDLSDARWNVVISVDGMQAAVIPKEGNYVFVNGYLLSYPTTRDVAVHISLCGTVPFVPENQEITVLRFSELGSQGQVISESEHTVVRRTKVIVPAGSPAPADTHTTETAFSTEKVPLSCIPAVCTLLMVFSLISIRRKG